MATTETLEEWVTNRSWQAVYEDECNSVDDAKFYATYYADSDNSKFDEESYGRVVERLTNSIIQTLETRGGY